MTIPDILRTYRTIAVVGQSDKPDRPSYAVSKYMLVQGYKIVPINPSLSYALNLPCYPSLRELPDALRRSVEIVNVFRRPEYVMPVVEEAIEIGAKVVWMQLGVVNEQARRRAEEAGLIVVQNRCIAVEHRLHILT
ncbi:MAG: CoA-binding protein [Chloroherpetonaceae bacterium]|nr:CoA-binding protein [Chloroherpetonaceae bacterium]MDW8020426.1 CoA-binding protein [Chloroherpetonaceae bacterium]